MRYETFVDADFLALQLLPEPGQYYRAKFHYLYEHERLDEGASE